LVLRKDLPLSCGLLSGAVSLNEQTVTDFVKDKAERVQIIHHHKIKAK
jgi:hypothetical protein